MNPDALGAMLIMTGLGIIVGYLTIYLILRYVKDDYQENKIRKS